MKRKLLVLVQVLVMILSVSVIASAATNAIKVTPSLSFTGSTAYCEAVIFQSGAIISATMELKHGSTVIASWSDAGTTKLTMSETVTVTSGQTYTLRVSGTVNGTAFTTAYVTTTCP